MILRMDGKHPDLEEQPERLEWQSTDGKVTASLQIHSPTECTIRFFHSIQERQGHGRVALQELRRKYCFIRVDNIGDENHPNRPFWLKMRREGLVDELRDDKGCVVLSKCN
jgi:hypothetical protein